MTVMKIESNQQREKVGQDAKSDNQSTYPTINSLQMSIMPIMSYHQCQKRMKRPSLHKMQKNGKLPWITR